MTEQDEWIRRMAAARKVVASAAADFEIAQERSQAAADAVGEADKRWGYASVAYERLRQEFESWLLEESECAS